ncbi:MAG: glycosyltransferase [Bacteroidales bacterium]
MKVTHVVYNVDANYGGIPVFVHNLATDLTKTMEVCIVCLKSQNPLEFSDDIIVNFADRSKIGINGYSSNLKKILKSNETDIIHANGVWTYPPNISAIIAKNRKIPYIHSLHGGVTSVAMMQKRCKKAIGWHMYQKRILSYADCLCTTSNMETANLRELGLTNRIAQFPLGVDTDLYRASQKQKKDKKTALFLARIQPIKGLDILIKAWSKLERRERESWSIKIAGNCLPQDYAYKQKLLDIVKYYNLEDEIEFVGEVFGENKIKIYQESDLFILPSYTENFGLVVAEALACGLPVITTKGTPWEDIDTYNAGQYIAVGIDPLVGALKHMLTISDAEREEMGRNGRNLIVTKYSNKMAAKNMIDLYSWILSSGDKPNFIID